MLTVSSPQGSDHTPHTNNLTPSQTHAQEQPQRPRPEHRQGTGGVNGLAQIHNLAAGDSRATIRHGGLLLGWIGLDTKDSLKRKPPPYLTTHTPFKQPKHPYE